MKKFHYRQTKIITGGGLQTKIITPKARLGPILRVVPVEVCSLNLLTGTHFLEDQVLAPSYRPMSADMMGKILGLRTRKLAPIEVVRSIYRECWKFYHESRAADSIYLGREELNLSLHRSNSLDIGFALLD